MVQNNAAPPSAPTLRLPGNFLQNVWNAQQQEDEPALVQALCQLDSALRRLNWLKSPNGSLAADGLDDRIQDFLLRILKLGRSKMAPPDNPGAYGKTIAHNLMCDAWSKQARRNRVNHKDVQQELEESGVFRLQDLQESEELEAQTQRLSDRFEGYVREYLKQADGMRGNASLQIRAWYHLRLRKQPAATVAEFLGVNTRADGGIQTVHAWASRGAQRLERLCTQDENPERAAIMRRASQSA